MCTPPISGEKPAENLVPAVVSDGRGDGAAVEPALEHHDVGPAGGHAGQPDGGLDGLGAGVRVEHRVQSGGKDLAELLGQFEQRLVHHGGVLRVDDLPAPVPGRPRPPSGWQ